MENVSYMFPRLPIHRKYDLKGSWVAREMIKLNEQPKMPTEEDKRTLKDMDMCYTVGLTSQARKDLVQAIKKDTDFLAEANIMDHSLFLSFHIVPSTDSHGTERLDLSEAPSSATPTGPSPRWLIPLAIPAT
jgi:1-phosphatidylinositol-5-phosphate 4-kinase